MPVEFTSEDALYDTGDQARPAVEIDFGVDWRGRHLTPTYRVSWNQGTQELLAVRSPGGQAILLGKVPTREDAERVLDGWQDWCGTRAPHGANGMSWLEERLESAGYLIPDDPTKGPVDF